MQAIGQTLRLLAHNKVGFAGFIGLVLFIFMAFVMPMIIPVDRETRMDKIYQPPSAEHLHELDPELVEVQVAPPEAPAPDFVGGDVERLVVRAAEGDIVGPGVAGSRAREDELDAAWLVEDLDPGLGGGDEVAAGRRGHPVEVPPGLVGGQVGVKERLFVG